MWQLYKKISLLSGMLQFHSFENGPGMANSIFLQILELLMKERNKQTKKERKIRNIWLRPEDFIMSLWAPTFCFSYRLTMSSVVGVWRTVRNVCVSCAGNEGMVHSSSTLQDTATRCRYVIPHLLDLLVSICAKISVQRLEASAGVASTWKNIRNHAHLSMIIILGHGYPWHNRFNIRIIS